jgi:threonine aldolase
VTPELTPSAASPRKSFGSDNHAGTHPAILRAIGEANAGDATAYGDDPWTARATAQLRDAFGASDVCFVFNGTGANVLALSLMLRPYQAVICAESAHLNVDECGAPEQILGSKLLTVPAPDGKLTPELIATRLGGRGDEHRAQPRAVAITQVTELGTCYSLDELRRLGEFCRDSGLLLYMDGARLANAAAYLGCSLADLAVGIDVLSFGGTKNGALGAEALIVMNPSLAADAPFLRKQQMQLASKMRFLAAQFLALLDDQLWMRNARHSNAMAQRLAGAVSGVPGVRLHQPVESNGVFVALDPALIEPLQREWHFHVWDDRDHVVRWMTAFDTSEEDVDAFVAGIREAAGALSV